jgi:tetratricopeptide (TPR) repeat protein
MTVASEGTPLEQARDAAARGDWRQAHDLLVEADASTPLAGPDLALLADVAYAAGHLDVTIEAWERAHADGVRAGDRLAAAGAAVRVAMHLLYDTALVAPVRGWLKRAERLLEGQDETPIHAWLAVIRSYERLLSGDFESARRSARRAIEVGAKRDPAAAALGRLVEARSLILEGDVHHGVDLLNEAAVASVSGELDPISAGIVYCEVVCAMQGLAQYDLAEEWTDSMERWHQGQPVGSLHGRCRVHRAEILRLRGCCAEAEEQALLACEELRPYLRRELGWPLTELGRIRLRRGNIEGAEEAFLAAHQAGWDPQPGLALVQLARGEATLAAVSIRQALDSPLSIPSKELPPNTELRRAPLLEALVEIEIAAGEVDRARSAADELVRVAELFQSKALVAGAVLAQARVRLAEGDTAAARRDFGVAVRHWSEIGAPYETARARIGLAQAHRADGDEPGALLEFRAARSTFEQIGAILEAGRAARACEGMHRVATGALAVEMMPAPAAEARPAGDNVFRREGEYWAVVFEGSTARLRDSKGLRYLARLLADQGQEFHVLELVAMESGGPDDAVEATQLGRALRVMGDAGELLDARAKEAYRRRLREIEEDIQEARAMGDIARAAQAEAEHEFLVRELARAVGIGGRDRRAGSASERARSAVTRAIRQALVRICHHDPQLAAHLDRAIRTGTYCAYLPDPRAAPRWKL